MASGGFKLAGEKQIGPVVAFANYIYNTAEGGGILIPEQILDAEALVPGRPLVAFNGRQRRRPARSRSAAAGTMRLVRMSGMGLSH